MHSAFNEKNPEISNDKVYFIAVVSNVFELYTNIITEVESIVGNEYNPFRNNRFVNIDVENLIIAAMMFVCERNKIKMDVQKIDEFMHRIFPNDKDYQMSKSTIERQYKRISENYKEVDIEHLNRSNKAVNLMGMQ